MQRLAASVMAASGFEGRSTDLGSPRARRTAGNARGKITREGAGARAPYRGPEPIPVGPGRIARTGFTVTHPRLGDTIAHWPRRCRCLGRRFRSSISQRDPRATQDYALGCSRWSAWRPSRPPRQAGCGRRLRFPFMVSPAPRYRAENFLHDKPEVDEHRASACQVFRAATGATCPRVCKPRVLHRPGRACASCCKRTLQGRQLCSESEFDGKYVRHPALILRASNGGVRAR